MCDRLEQIRERWKSGVTDQHTTELFATAFGDLGWLIAKVDSLRDAAEAVSDLQQEVGRLEAIPCIVEHKKVFAEGMEEAARVAKRCELAGMGALAVVGAIRAAAADKESTAFSPEDS